MRQIIFLLIICFSIVTDLYSYSIQIKNVVITEKNILSLKDICDIKENNEYFSSIKDIPLINIEDFPKHKKISGDVIKNILEKTSVKALLSEIYIPDYVDIYKGKIVLTKIQLINILKNYVKSYTPYLRGDKIIRDISLPEYMELREGEKITIKPIGGKIRPGHNSISFVIVKNNKQVRIRPAKFFLDVFAPVPCAARPLNRGEMLTPEKVTFEKKNLAYLPKNIWDGKSGPWRIKIPIGTHEPITLLKLEPMPTITKGQKVNLIYSGEHILLRTIAIATEDGKIGDIIKVINLQSKRYVYGKIINNETVEVR